MKSLFLLFLFFFLFPARSSETSPPEAQQLHAEVIKEYPHDETAYTQGLEFYESDLYESTGLYGQSSLRKVDETTGETLQKIDRDTTYFAEGITVAENKIYQLTWKSEKVFIQPLLGSDLKGPTTVLSYEGEGWGLCYDEHRYLIRSDGSDQLYFHERDTFKVSRSLEVTLDGKSLSKLNELECVNGFVWANIFESSTIVKIDSTTGQVLDVVDVSELVARHKKSPEKVLNGIAYNEQTGTFWITGKKWDTLYEVEFLPNS